MSRWLAAMAASGLIASGAAAQAGDPAAGKAVFAKCGICHAIGPNAVAKIGPPLNGIIGRMSATYPAFPYTAGMKAYNVTWAPKTLDDYLVAPMKKVPGTKMVFVGLPAAKDRADVIAYLASFKADGSSKK